MTPVLLALAVAAAGYPTAVSRSRRPWPLTRTVCWLTGLGCVAVALSGPPASGHTDLRAHMAGHLLLGMVAPVLLALGQPVTLALRTLTPPHARRLTGLLRTAPVRALTDPFTATAVNAAGLWLLYRTGLLMATMHSPRLHVLVSLHILLTGWLATAAVLALEPTAHRRGAVARAVSLAAGAAAHDVLAKSIYAAPPAGVTGAAAGAQLMYSGGTVAHLVVAGLLWRHWYRSRESVREAEVLRAAAPDG